MGMFSIFFNMKVCCVFSLDSPHRSDLNEYTQYTIFNIQKENYLNYTKSATMEFCSKGLKNEFETAVVNEPSVFRAIKGLLHNFQPLFRYSCSNLIICMNRKSLSGQVC